MTHLSTLYAHCAPLAYTAYIFFTLRYVLNCCIVGQYLYLAAAVLGSSSAHELNATVHTACVQHIEGTNDSVCTHTSITAATAIASVVCR
jgi:hypothetical protein